MKLPFLLPGLVVMALIFGFQISAQAEYRVFQLEITSADGNVKSFPSTLDPDQYRGYYPLRADDKISYVQTWMCKGRTVGYAPPCENPKANGADRFPAEAPPSTDKGPEPQAPPTN